MSLEDAFNKMKKGMRSLACAGLVSLAVVGGAREAKGDIITWNYDDNFSGTKAESDNYQHSTFSTQHLILTRDNSRTWPMPALEAGPSLYFAEVSYSRYYSKPFEVLLFRCSEANEPANLTYRFPLDNELATIESGTVVIGTPMSNPLAYVLIPSGLSYELSSDGNNWLPPKGIYEGGGVANLLPSDNSFTYIRFSGKGALLDSIRVTITGQAIPEPATLVMMAGGAFALTRRNEWKRKEK
jgi:hypothetical protein